MLYACLSKVKGHDRASTGKGAYNGHPPPFPCRDVNELFIDFKQKA